MNNPPRLVMREVRRSGGRILRCVTRFDAEQGGRVMELTAVWPDTVGYAESVAPQDRRPGSEARDA